MIRRIVRSKGKPELASNTQINKMTGSAAQPQQPGFLGFTRTNRAPQFRQ